MLMDVKNVSKECKNLILFNDVNFSLKEGNCIAIKCSEEIAKALFSIFLGEMSPSRGSIYIEDKSKITAIFKDEGMYERLKASEYLDFYRGIYAFNGSIKSIVSKLGLEEIMDKKIKKLTFSEKKRLSMARAMMSDAKIILIQEPTLNLDRESALIMRGFIPYVCSLGISIIAVSISLEEIMLLEGTNYILDEKGFRLIETDNQDEKISENSSELTETDNYLLKIDKIPAKVEGKIILFNPSEIMYIESMDGTSYIAVNNEKLPCTMTLNELENTLQSFGFFRCHRSYLVNLQRVREVVTWTRNSFSFTLDDKNKTSIPLSKGRMEEVKKVLRL